MDSTKRKCEPPAAETAPKRCHVDTEDDGQVDHEIAEDLVQQYIENQDVEAWRSKSGIAPDDGDAIFSKLKITGSVGADGEPAKMIVTPLPTFPLYVQQLAEEGGFDDDEDDPTLDTAAAEILAHIVATYDAVMADIVKEVAEMRKEGDMTQSGFTFELDSDGSACNVVIG
jgi:hypothetical protein